MQITLQGDTPSKKNSKIIVCRGKRPMLLPSTNYKAWHETQMWYLKTNHKVTNFPVRVMELTIYPSTKRAGDLTNKAESVMDLLVDAGILEDDNWFVCSTINLRFGGVDKEHPRVEINMH